ncbi:MAG: YncE family protein [Cytophagaceae bacterium]
MKDKPDIKPINPGSISQGAGLYICNEGNYQWGNSSVSYFRYSDSAVSDDIFKYVNNRPLGDVCQSMKIFNGKGYVVVNNSGKVEVVNPENFQSIATIKELPSPRYICPVGTDKAYVTNFTGNEISVIDLNANVRLKGIKVRGWTEEMEMSGNRMYVVNRANDQILIVDISQDIIIDSIKVGNEPNSIKKDKNNKLWIICGTADSPGGKCSIYKIDPVTKSVEFQEEFVARSTNPRLAINGTADTLYYLNGGVFRISINNTFIPDKAFIEEGNRILYSIGVHPVNGSIYVSDAIDYTQKGVVYIYRPDGYYLNKFNAGVIPGYFCFY